MILLSRRYIVDRIKRTKSQSFFIKIFETTGGETERNKRKATPGKIEDQNMRAINFIAKNNQYQVEELNKNTRVSREKQAGKIVGSLNYKKITASIFSSLLYLCLSLFLSSTVFGQSQSTTNAADQTLRSNGRVNPSSLGMEMDIPLGSYPARGINLPLGLSYSSKLWRFEPYTTVDVGSHSNVYVIPKYSENAASGWTTSLSQPYIEYTGEMNLFDDVGRPLQEVYSQGQQTPAGENYVRRITVYLPGGGSHELVAEMEPIATSGYGQGAPASAWEGTFYATDGSGVKYVQNSAANPAVYRLYMPDGSFYDFNPTRENSLKQPRRAYRLTDAHGNYAQFYAATTAYPNGYWKDTLGRDFPVMIPGEAPAMPSNTEVLTQSFAMPGIDPNTPYKLRWKRLQGSSAATSAFTPNQNYQLKYAGHTQTGASPTTYGPTLFYDNTQISSCSGDKLKVLESGVLFNPVVLSEVELPNGAKYRFSYNEYGEIDRIDYPTGGYESIHYDKVASLAELGAPYQMSNRGVTLREIYESVNDSTADEWTYTAQSSANNYRTSVIAPDGTRTDRFMHRGVPGPGCVGPDAVGTSMNYYDPRWGYDNPLAGMPYEERSFASGGALKQRTITRWTTTATAIPMTLYPSRNVQRNARTSSTETIVYESAGTGLSSVTTMEYDTDADDLGSPLNVTKTTQHAFQTSAWDSSIIPDQAPPPGLIAPNLPQGLTAVKSVVTGYLSNTTYRDRNLVKLPLEIVVTDGQNVPKAKTSIQYDQTSRLESASISNAPGWTNPGTNARGLATTTTAWKDIGVNNETIVTYTDYDQFGNVRKNYNANGMTEIEYTDNFTDNVNHYTYAFPTKTISPTPSDGTHGSNASFVTTVKYDFQAGLPTSAIDPNGQETLMSYRDPVTNVLDPLLRLRKTTAPNGHQTITEYGVPDSSGQLQASQRFIKVKTQIDGTNWKEVYTWADGLGRTIKAQSVDSNGDVFTETEYDRMNRPKKVTSPYRNGETKYWTETTLDAAGRIWKVTTPDGAIVETNYSLATSGSQIGTVVTGIDQAGKQRRSVTNVLGQLTRVDEPDVNNGNQLGVVSSPYQYTSYTYDTLNNLTTVTQGAQTRTFVYDSLSRLKSATSPEMGSIVGGNYVPGTISYTYDDNGNLTTKTDPRGITTTYAYDALNRVKTRTYSNEPTGQTTPAVDYYYDLLPNAKGKLIEVDNGVSETKYLSFDTMGRVTSSQQKTDGTTYNPMTYVYNLSGALIEETYPSGRVVRNVLDNDGELSVVQSKKNTNAGFWNYAQHLTYTAAGAVSSMQLGNGRWESTVFNSRLQPEQIALGSTKNATDKLKLNFSYTTTPTSTDNNGNILSQTVTVPTETRGGMTYDGFTATQTYTYDSLNRIKTAEETIPGQTGWKQTYKYDRYGNRNFDYGTNPLAPETTLPASQGTLPKVVNPEILTTNNRFKSDQDNDSIDDYLYDASGNTTKDAPGRTFTYDAENKQTEVKDAQNVSLGIYFYDGDGKRVKKIAGSEVTIFVYDASGNLAAEYANQITQNPQVSYLTTDHLGSPRINTDKNGNVMARHDYQPFGEEVARISYGTDNVRNKFTAYERDMETELDFAEARYYQPLNGRFTSTDPIIMSFKRAADPQQINLYAYSRNNPLKYIDPSGEDIDEPTGLSAEDQKAYEKWRDKLLSTEEGRKTWERYKKDPNFKLKIVVADRGNEGKNKSAIVDSFTYDSQGNLAGATMTLGRNLGKGVPGVGGGYIVMGNLDEAAMDSATLGAIKMAHEFAHLDDYRSMGTSFQERQQLMEAHMKRVDELPIIQRDNDPVLKEIDRQFKEKNFGPSVMQEDNDEESRADIIAIPTIRQLYGSIPSKAQKAVRNFQNPRPVKSKNK